MINFHNETSLSYAKGSKARNLLLSHMARMTKKIYNLLKNKNISELRGKGASYSKLNIPRNFRKLSQEADHGLQQFKSSFRSSLLQWQKFKNDQLQRSTKEKQPEQNSQVDTNENKTKRNTHATVPIKQRLQNQAYEVIESKAAVNKNEVKVSGKDSDFAEEKKRDSQICIFLRKNKMYSGSYTSQLVTNRLTSRLYKSI
ncbi:hypothetical protein HPG69_001600 [Diceros bicornis minor]|uniref:Uncharacterized protein n=1 Tax=Diceros bicornis minor TaxID=77932 RepID=A0A7J7FG50_DICBM|nr:hypothetical protein HPG69_001600 [Diceros bicornis minor]